MPTRTEDHPLAYANFEGTIPPGHHGAGNIVIWDQGRWAPLGEPQAGHEVVQALQDSALPHGLVDGVLQLHHQGVVLRARGISGCSTRHCKGPAMALQTAGLALSQPPVHLKRAACLIERGAAGSS